MTEPTPLRSVAHVATERGERYGKQLAAHMGRKIEVQQEEQGERLLFGFGTCLLEVRDDVLVMHADGEDAEALARVEDVVARHLIKFGTRDELVVEWRSL